MAKSVRCQCDCKDGNSTPHESGICYLCREGTHAPPNRAELRKKLYPWQR